MPDDDRAAQSTDALERRYAEEISARDERIASLQCALKEVMATSELRNELARRGVRRIDQAARLLSGRVSVELAGDRPAVRVLDESGAAQLDADGTPTTIAAMVEAWVGDNPHFLPASGDAGSGARRGTIEPRAPDLAALDASPRRKAAFIAEHGPEALVRLARHRKNGL